MDWSKSDSDLKVDEEPSAAYHTPLTVPKGRKKKKKKKKCPTLTSTPSITSRSATKSLPSSVWDDSSSLFSSTERYSSLLKQLDCLAKFWDSEHIRSCDSFTRLATCILHCSQNRIPDCLNLRNVPLDALKMLRDDLTEQAHKLCFGYAIETGFAEVQSHLENLTGCRTQLQAWIDQLVAVEELMEQTSQLNVSSPKISVGGNPRVPVFWMAIVAESRGLLCRLEKDLNYKQQLLDSVSHCHTAQGAYHLALSWGHLGNLVRWSAVTELTCHASEILSY